jgi:hypothetical protein
MALREVASQTFQFLVELVRVVVWRTVVRLPWTLITSVAVLLAVAGPGQHIMNLHAPSSVVHWFTVVLWFLCFGLAGILWGLHRAIYDSAHEGIRLCQEKGAEAASAGIDPVLAKLPVGKSEYPIGFLREQWAAWTKELVWRDPGSRRYSPAAQLTNWLARKWVAVQAAVVTQTLDELEAFGEKAVSAASLKRFVVHRSASAMAEAARRNVRFWTFVTAAVVFLLIVSPAVLTTTISVLTHSS